MVVVVVAVVVVVMVGVVVVVGVVACYSSCSRRRGLCQARLS